MRQKVTTVLLMVLLVATVGCTPSARKLGSAEDSICTTYSDIEEAESMDGADFKAYRWEDRGLSVKLYVGLHPDYPRMQDIFAKYPKVDLITLVHGGQTAERLDRIYAYPRSDGFPSFVHLSIAGGDQSSQTALADRIGGSLRLCGSVSRND